MIKFSNSLQYICPKIKWEDWIAEVILEFIINIISDQMIIPEVVNSNLNKRKLLHSFLNLFNSKENQEEQINSINIYIKEIWT